VARITITGTDTDKIYLAQDLSFKIKYPYQPLIIYAACTTNMLEIRDMYRGRIGTGTRNLAVYFNVFAV
jgi:hypothetical protein